MPLLNTDKFTHNVAQVIVFLQVPTDCFACWKFVNCDFKKPAWILLAIVLCQVGFKLYVIFSVNTIGSYCFRFHLNISNQF